MNSSSNISMPSLETIALAWAEIDRNSLIETFPDCRVKYLGFGEPCCFRCGWLAPVPESSCYQEDTEELVLKKTWKQASGWLERCHLQDAACGGSSGVFNLVPLCIFCHQEQPLCETRYDGIGFVNSSPSNPKQLTSAVQHITDLLYKEKKKDEKPSGKGDIWKAMIHAQSLAGKAFIVTQEIWYSEDEDKVVERLQSLRFSEDQIQNLLEVWRLDSLR